MATRRRIPPPPYRKAAIPLTGERPNLGPKTKMVVRKHTRPDGSVLVERIPSFLFKQPLDRLPEGFEIES